jgi:hypothetical protein
MVQTLLNALHTKLLWIVIGLLTLIAGAVTYQTQMHVREQVEGQRKAAEMQREMEKAARQEQTLRQPGDMPLFHNQPKKK